MEQGAGEELQEEDEGEDVEHSHRRGRYPPGQRGRQPAQIVGSIFLLELYMHINRHQPSQILTFWINFPSL